MKCKICDNDNDFIFFGKILNKYNIKYYYCSNCGFLQTEEPYWLEESYAESINITDTGILQRNISLSKIVSVLIYFLFNKNKKFLDYAGGYGIFTRLLRDIGFDFYWYDPYCKNLVSRGFEYNNEDIELMTTFETFEHFDNPMIEIEKMLTITKNIIFTTEILQDPIPKPENWWYYGLEHGQHISFYSIKTLEYIAKKYNLKFYTNNYNLHIFTNKNFLIENLSLLVNDNHIKNPRLFILKNIIKYTLGKIKINDLIKNLSEFNIRYNFSLIKKNKNINDLVNWIFKNHNILFDIFVKSQVESKIFNDMLLLKNKITNC